MYAFGGEWPGIYDTNEEYDPVTNKWRSVLKMPEAWKAVCTVVVGDSIYSFGGYTAAGMTGRGLVWIPPANPTGLQAGPRKTAGRGPRLLFDGRLLRFEGRDAAGRDVTLELRNR
jgi:hypothetical protein